MKLSVFTSKPLSLVEASPSSSTSASMSASAAVVIASAIDFCHWVSVLLMRTMKSSEVVSNGRRLKVCCVCA